MLAFPGGGGGGGKTGQGGGGGGGVAKVLAPPSFESLLAISVEEIAGSASLIFLLELLLSSKLEFLLLFDLGTVSEPFSFTLRLPTSFCA